MKYYGSLNNRLNENKMFCDEIKVGTGVTEYSYSDREAYEVIEVKDQKHVRIRLLDHKAAGPCYSNQWELVSNESNPTYSLVKRGNYWYSVSVLTSDDLKEMDDMEKLRAAVAGFDLEKIETKGKQTKYHKRNVSFGVANYYYDYSF